MDDRLRRLERVWKETGSAADERAFRQAQLRAGALNEDDLVAMSIRQVLIRPTGKLGKGTDPRTVLAELTRHDPLLHIREAHEEQLPIWQVARRLGWTRTLAAPSDALLNDAIARFQNEIQRDLDISPPAPVFHQIFSGQIHHVVNDHWDEVQAQVYLTFTRRADLRSFEVVAGEHPERLVEAVRAGLAKALPYAEPVWLPLSGFDVSFSVPGNPGESDLYWVVSEAIRHLAHDTARNQILEPWVRVTVIGANAGQAIHALAREGGWADGGEGNTHHGVIALRRLPRARKRIEQEGCGVTWVYERHEPANEDRQGIERLLKDLGWDLGDA